MTTSRFLCAALLSSVTSVGLACEIPPLVVIPAKEDAIGKEAEIRAETATYFQLMRAYTACIQAEIAAAGGEAAPPFLRAVLVQRNNLAVAEAEAVVKLFTENIGPIASPGPSPEPAAN